MLARARLGDQTGLAHLFGEQRLSQHVVDFMRARVVEILALEVNFRPAEILRHTSGVIEPRGSPRVLVEKLGKLPLELGIVFVMVVSILQFNYRVHQRFGQVLPAVDAESSFGHWFFQSFLAALTAAHIF